MAESSASPRASATQSLGSRNKKKADDLDARQTPTKPLAAWQLREQMKAQSRAPPAVGRIQRPRPKIELDSDGVDPSLPPAFRAAFARQRKKRVDDFNSLASVHTTTSTMMTDNTANASDSEDGSSSFDGHDSFASLGDDEEDDEAYREGRNQIARQTIECSRTPTGSSRGTLKSNDFRFKKGGVIGTPLDFIAE